MLLRWKRIVVWVGLLIAFGAMGVLWSFRSAPHIPPMPSPTSWIGLPESGMDATDPFVRQALLRASSHGGFDEGRYDSLVASCGSGIIDSADETYVIVLASPGLTPNPQARRVTFAVYGDQVSVGIQDAHSLVFPPPPPLKNSRLSSDPAQIPTTTWIMFPKSRLQPIADAWRNRALWQAPQQGAFCTDAGVVILEACVGGRYAARDRSCGLETGVNDGLNGLWSVMSRLLPLQDKPAP